MKTAEEWAHECYDDNAGQYEDASLSYGQYVALTKRIQRDALESAAEICRDEPEKWHAFKIEALMPEEP